MFRYLRAAFTARPRVPGLGGVPFNLLGLAGFGILGAANPAFWALGLGFEAAAPAAAPAKSMGPVAEKQ